MSGLLKSWWGGGNAAKGDEEKGSSESASGDQPPPPTKDNAWVKGFGDVLSSVSGYASNLKETVQKTSFLNDFEEEQKRFEREQQRQKDCAVPPWVGFNEEEQMKAQILNLSSDSRNVLRNPPPGIQFHFDFAKSYPVALALLKEDSRLQKLRFELVPKKLKEERFWHNYFYRVFLIRQSSQLASLVSAEQNVTASASSSAEGLPQESNAQEETAPATTSLPDSFTDISHHHTQDGSSEDFASDALVMGQGEEEQAISRESVRAELDQLGVEDQQELEGEEWEEELAKELEGLSEEGNGVGEEGELGTDEQWENELKLMLESHPTDDS